MLDIKPTPASRIKARWESRMRAARVADHSRH
jgi:hypothetical protein